MTRESLLGLDGCLGVREGTVAMHAVFRLGPDASRSALERGLGVDGARCRSVALEEMFIELVGGRASAQGGQA